MIGIYFSGTGNTKYCVERFLFYYQNNGNAISIESENVLQEIKKNKNIVFGYPIYYSNLPKIVTDFIHKNRQIFKEKNIFLIATMGLFSGDGTGCAARILKRYKANIIGGLHLKMPDSIGDVKLLKRSFKRNQELVIKADRKINLSVEQLKNGNPTKEGLGVGAQAAGFLGQRMWFYHMTRDYSDRLKIDFFKCIGCGKCAAICPMNNLDIVGKKAVSKKHCTMCYRCISMCPQKAITLLGKQVVEQNQIEKYMKKNPEK